MHTGGLGAIRWDVDPVMFSLFGFEVKWYGVMFSVSFFLGYLLMQRIFRTENRRESDLDTLFVVMIISTVVGARLGHMFFYEWDTTINDPIQILYIRNGGLASHGAAMVIPLGLWWYIRRHPDQPFLWLIDRICIPVALGGAFVRFGNLINSEIIGAPTTLPWGFIFVRNKEAGLVPRHPSQIYEIIYCLITLAVLWVLYRRWKMATPRGLLLGTFLIIIFGARIAVEALKENQEAFEDGLTLNMGQILSLPAVAVGVVLVVLALRRGPAPALAPAA